MSKIIKIKRGRKVGLPSLSKGELGYAKDTQEFYIGDGETNVLVNSTDGDKWITPIVTFTEIGFNNVKFTIENEEDFEVTVKYELNTPPTENSVVIDANDVSEELEITGLDAEEEYILYVQAFVGSEAISVIVEYSFTTIIGVVPIVNFTQISFDNVRFTIENEEDFEITVKYELNTPPTVDSVVIDANDISEELEITGLDEEEEYILYVQTFVNSEAISGIVEYPFTTTVQFGGGL